MTKMHIASVRFSFVFLIAALTGCTSAESVQCEIDEHCNRLAEGECTTASTGNSWCTYADSTCESGRRWSDLDVGDELSGQCLSDTADRDAGVVDAMTLIDGGNVIDAASADAGMSADDASSIDASPSTDAGPGPIVEDVAHVPNAAEFAGVANLVLANGDVIDTTSLELNGMPLPAGVTFDTSPQEIGTAPELAVLHVRSLEVAAGATVTVIGDRPMVVIASHEIWINGSLDASATGDSPGAGGYTPGQGPGAGGDGGPWTEGPLLDGGGGGAGFGTAGARGGYGQCFPPCTQPVPGEAGDTYGDSSITELIGGSGGGRGSAGQSPSCTGPGGAGGGALQLYSGVLVQVGPAGRISVGGGGGEGGKSCTDSGAGSGGGSGGAIFLQAPTVSHEGILAANGGGGGGAGVTDGSDGDAGADGTMGTLPASGGAGGGAMAGVGGNGGAGSTPPHPGSDQLPNQEPDGGGGGGAVGRIVMIVNTSGTLTNNGASSPNAVTGTYN